MSSVQSVDSAIKATRKARVSSPAVQRSWAIDEAELRGRQLETDESEYVAALEDSAPRFIAALYNVARAFEDAPEQFNAMVAERIKERGGLTRQPKYRYQPLVRAFVSTETWKRSKSTMTRYAVAIEGLMLGERGGDAIHPAVAFDWMSDANDRSAPGKGLAKAIALYTKHPDTKAERTAAKRGRKSAALRRIERAKHCEHVPAKALIGRTYALAFIEIEPDTGEHRLLLAKDDHELDQDGMAVLAGVLEKVWPHHTDPSDGGADDESDDEPVED